MKATIVLGVIALLLFGYIVLFDRGSLGTRDLEARQGSVLPELVRDRIVKLELQHKGVTTVLERNPEAETDEEQLWRVTAPYQAAADQDAVDTVMGDLEWLHPKRTLRGVSTEDLKRFGLTAPRYRAWFTVGKERLGVRVGTETPQHDGVYVAASEPNTVFIVGKDFAEALAQPAEHYHTKTLHEGVLTSTARRVEVRDAAGTRMVKRAPDALWMVVEPSASKDMLAATAEISALIEAADQLKATRYVSSDKSALARYGLAPAQLEVAIHKRSKIDLEGKGNEGPELLALRVRAGAPCEGQPTERYVTVGDAGVVFCAQNADLDNLKLPGDKLIETKLLPIDPRDLHGARITRGDRSLLLERVGGIPQPGAPEPWRYEQKRGDKIVAQGSARDGSIDDYFSALRAAESVKDASASGSAKGANFTATFLRDQSKPELVLHVAVRGLEEALVQRQAEPHSLVFPAAAVELLDPSAAPFKPLELLQHNEANLRSLELTRGGATERVERTDAGAPFTVKAPIELEADRIALADVARLFSTLQAVRFVADAAEPVHGLSTPAVEVRASYAAQGEDGKPASSLLRIGAATEGGYFAQLEADPSVFVVSAQLAELLKAPLASRTLLATPLDRIAGIEVTHGGRSTRVEGASDLAQKVATLRAVSAVSYGAPTADQGFKAPFATLRVERTSGEAALELLIGAQAPTGDRYARRRDVDVTLLVPANAVEALLAPLKQP
jgi:hypothetical protein